MPLLSMMLPIAHPFSAARRYRESSLVRATREHDVITLAEFPGCSFVVVHISFTPFKVLFIE